MTKEGLIVAVQAELDCKREEARAMVEDTLALWSDALVEEGQVKLSRFGNFDVRPKRARRGRDPRSGQPLTIAAHQVLTFRSSPTLKAQLNDGWCGDDEPEA